MSLSPRSTLRRAVAALALLMPLGAVLGAEPGVTPQTIVIGQTITLEAGKNAYGTAVLAGMRLVIDETNAAGGVHGRRIELRTLDDKGKATEAEKNARQLTGEGVFALFGSIEGGPSVAVANVAAEQKVPFIGPVAGSPTLRRPHNPMVFPVRAEHRDEFQALMRWGAETGLKTIGFLHADSEVGRQHLANVQAIAQELGLKIVYAAPLGPDVDANVKAMAAARPDMVFNHGAAGAYVKLIQSARAAGVRSTFMAVNSGSSQIAEALGPDASGMVFSQVVPSPWERKHAISRGYRSSLARAKGAEPTASDLSYGGLEGYVTAKALVLALQQAGPQLSRAGLVRTLETKGLAFDDVQLRYKPGDHQGWNFVDLSMVTREGRFIH